MTLHGGSSVVRFPIANARVTPAEYDDKGTEEACRNREDRLLCASVIRVFFIVCCTCTYSLIDLELTGKTGLIDLGLTGKTV